MGVSRYREEALGWGVAELEVRFRFVFSFFRVKLHVLLTRNKQVYWSDWNRFLLLGGEQFKVRLYESVS